MIRKIPIIGIAGGIASGKSFVSEHLRRLGAEVVSADELAHQTLKLEDVKRQVRDRWGAGVFTAGGEVDRKALAQIVFAPPPAGAAELKYLEGITHPRIGELARERITRLQEAGSAAAIVLDVPLLFESGWNTFCDKIVYVDAPRAVREARAIARGWTVEEFARREAAQEALETKRNLADLVIDNSNTPQAVIARIESFWNTL